MTGRVLWETTARQGEGKYFFHGDMLITPDLVVAGADRATAAGGAQVHAFDRATGRERWTRPAGSGVAAALTSLDGRVFAVTLGGELWTLDLASGERQWTFPLKTRWWEAPASGAGRVFAGGTDGTLSALDAATGRVIWQTPMGGEITTTITRHDSSLYVGTVDGRLHRVDSDSGRIVSSQQLDTTLRSRSVPIATSDAVFVLLSDAGEDVRAVVSLTPSLDRIRWRVPAPPPGRWMTTRILTADNLIVLGTSTGTVTAYCASDGTPAWSHTVTGTVRSIGKAEGVNDTLYVGTVEGRLYAIDPPPACGKG